MAPVYSQRWPTYAKWWDTGKIRSDRTKEVASVSARLHSHKDRYQTVQKRTGVPWWLIAGIHERESSGSFSHQLAQGDPLGRVSTHVPKGMGPYFGPDAWERSALEALERDGLTKVIDWTIEKALFYAEKYNGWGYATNHPATPSPYIVGGSTVQKPGKYIADGVWSASTMDQQLGVMTLIMGLMQIDKTIQVIRETPMGAPLKKPEQPKPSIASVAAAKPWWKFWG